MAKPGTRPVVSVLLALCAVLAAGAASAGSAAAQLPTLPPPAEEAVGAPVGKVTETVEGVTNGVLTPAEETTEAVTAAPPVAEATETVTPPVKEVTESATKATEEATHAVTAPANQAAPVVPSPQAVHVPTVTKPKAPSAGSTVSGVWGSRSTAGVTSSGSSAGRVHSVPAASAPSEAVTSSPPSQAAPAEAEGPVAEPSGDDRISKVPTEGGAVRAPVPKWVAYVWPAIALTWRHPGTLPDHARQVGAADLSSAAVEDSAGGDASGHGVKGVHAAGGLPPGHGGHSSSLFEKVPAAVGRFTSGVPGEALAYLLLVALLVGTVFAGVKFELRRRGPGAE